MNYAVFQASGRQYKVKEGDILEVDHITSDSKSLTFEDVLMVIGDSEVAIGRPTVANAKVIAKVLEHTKGDKIRVSKYKAKVRYRRVMGFRPSLTRIQIEKIEVNAKEASVPATAKKTKKAEK